MSQDTAPDQQPLLERVDSDSTIMLPHEGPAFAWLVVVDGIRRGRLKRLDTAGTTVGRADDNDIAIEDETVSRYHARLYAEHLGDTLRFSVQDLASANGTFVNDQRVSRQAIIDEDRLAFGDTIFVFKQL